jgi:hypothetical protein
VVLREKMKQHVEVSLEKASVMAEINSDEQVRVASRR